MKDIRRVAIAGAGTMGYSLAQAFSAAGYPVKLYDLFPAALDKARDMIALNQQTEVTSGKLTAEQSAALVGRISFTSRLEDLVDTDFLVEAILKSWRSSTISTASCAPLWRRMPFCAATPPD